jgi:hypothetical protein
MAPAVTSVGRQQWVDQIKSKNALRDVTLAMASRRLTAEQLCTGPPLSRKVDSLGVVTFRQPPHRTPN